MEIRWNGDTVKNFKKNPTGVVKQNLNDIGDGFKQIGSAAGTVGKNAVNKGVSSAKGLFKKVGKLFK